MVIVTHESYDSVLAGTGKQKGLESLSENREWRRRCDVERQVVPDGGTRNRKRFNKYVSKRISKWMIYSASTSGKNQGTEGCNSRWKIALWDWANDIREGDLELFTLWSARRHRPANVVGWIEVSFVGKTRIVARLFGNLYRFEWTLVIGRQKSCTDTVVTGRQTSSSLCMLFKLTYATQVHARRDKHKRH